jgi:hypothetical protein
LKRIIIIAAAAAAAAAAVAALGVGVTVGSTDQGHGSSSTVAPQTLPPGVTAAPQGGPTPEQLCEQAAQQLRAKHPDAYIGACNHGEGTLPVP